MPDLFKAVDEIASVWASPDKNDVVKKIWYDLQTQTIDYGIVERAERVAVLPAGGLGWSDVGAWDSLFDVLLPDLNGNVSVNAQHLPAFTGIGLAISRINTNTAVKLLAVPIGFAPAVFTHAFHNTFSGLIGGLGGFIAGTAVDYLGYAFMLGSIIWMIVPERNLLKRHLPEEVEKGYLSRRQYDSALSFFQLNAYLSAIPSGSFLKTARFYQVCGELAHKKEQFTRHGDENGNRRIIEDLRSELVALAPVAKT